MVSDSTTLSDFADEVSLWQPPESVTLHSGGAHQPNDDFFVVPPPEIGGVTSAHSTLKTTKRPKPFAMRLVLSLAIGSLIYVGGSELASHFVARRDLFTFQTLAFVGGAIAIGVVWFATRFRGEVTYVGSLGVARYRLKGSRAAPPIGEALVFSQADELRTSQTRHFHNGIYTHTTYHFHWTDAQGRRRFSIAGKFNNKEGRPADRDGFWFAMASEAAWSAHFFELSVRQLEQQGCIRFNLHDNRYVLVGPGFLEFSWAAESRLTPADVKTLGLSQGIFSVATHDARWYNRKGKFQFPYGELANAQVFDLAVERLFQGGGRE